MIGPFGIQVETREYLKDANGLLDTVIDTMCFSITPLVPHVVGFTRREDAPVQVSKR